MKRKCGPVEFGDQDWSQFDFSRWQLNDLQLDEPATMLANLAQQFFASPEWRQHFTGNLTTVKTQALTYFEQQEKALEAKTIEINQELEARTASIRKQITSQQERLRRAAAPLLLTAEPTLFQLGIKILAKDQQLGLPAVEVQLIVPSQKGRVLDKGTTDLDGDVLFSLTQEQVEELTKAQIEIAVEVLNPQGKPIHRIDKTICPHVDQTDTRIVSIASKDLESSVAQANQRRAEQETQLSTLTEKISRLQSEYQMMAQDIRCQLEDIRTVIQQLKRE